MRYDEYLRDGLPIGTGTIEGACRYLVKDRMDITGARWGINGAEAVLLFRSLAVSGGLERFHRARNSSATTARPTPSTKTKGSR